MAQEFLVLKKLLVALYLIMGVAVLLKAQDTTSDLPNGYKEFTLGLTMDTVKSLLAKSTEFDSVREDILSIRIEPDREIITVKGRGYIQRAYFHFHDNKLFHIYMLLDEKKVGYYNLLKRFTEKYGTPKSFEPKRASWRNASIRLLIEKPAVVKYTDMNVWDALGATDLSDRNIQKENRDQFIDGF